MPCFDRRNRHLLEGSSGALILIGLGVLFLADAFWPWILVVIGVASLPAAVAHKGLWAGLKGPLWMFGLAILFATNSLWPGILILIGISMLLGMVDAPTPREKRKRKRGLPVDDPALYAPEDAPEAW